MTRCGAAGRGDAAARDDSLAQMRGRASLTSKEAPGGNGMAQALRLDYLAMLAAFVFVAAIVSGAF